MKRIEVPAETLLAEIDLRRFEIHHAVTFGEVLHNLNSHLLEQEIEIVPVISEGATRYENMLVKRMQPRGEGNVTG